MINESTDIFTVINGRNESTVFLERVSPGIIFIHPPEELVIEVKVHGRYIRTLWSKNLNNIETELLYSNGNIFAVKETTLDDLGLYEVCVLPDVSIGQRLIPTSLDFIVTHPGLCYNIM